ncbi:MAG: 4Fe-4S dicluster domain-containing protein [Rhodospirillales bacterium]|nr:MAG: 4Fe-4S dicluster domain-containing protein [Rhodospirillales bacterium]
MEARLAVHGLRVRGAIHDEAGFATLVLIGYPGGEMWPAFLKGRLDEPDPLDSWTKRVIEPLAAEVGAVALYPFAGPPWLPFQRWAMRAEGLRPSPIGPLIHPVYGPWHGWRAALGFAGRLDLPEPPEAVDICAACQDKPCLSACPAQVFASGRYDVPACAVHLRSQGNACLRGGCLARKACPVGAEHAYSQEQGAFHTRSFLASMDRFG